MYRGQVFEASVPQTQAIQRGKPLNKENQQPNSLMQMTSQTSQHGKIT